MIVWNQEAKESYVERTNEMCKQTRAERKELTSMEVSTQSHGTLCIYSNIVF